MIPNTHKNETKPQPQKILRHRLYSLLTLSQQRRGQTIGGGRCRGRGCTWWCWGLTPLVLSRPYPWTLSLLLIALHLLLAPRPPVSREGKGSEVERCLPCCTVSYLSHSSPGLVDLLPSLLLMLRHFPGQQSWGQISGLCSSGPPQGRVEHIPRGSS